MSITNSLWPCIACLFLSDCETVVGLLSTPVTMLSSPVSVAKYAYFHTLHGSHHTHHVAEIGVVLSHFNVE